MTKTILTLEWEDIEAHLPDGFEVDSGRKEQILDEVSNKLGNNNILLERFSEAIREAVADVAGSG